MAKPKLCLIPAAQGSKLFSVLPSSGVGDFDFSRSGTATRINSQGLIEEVDDGVSRLNYPMIDGKVVGCPHHILEPSRTNLIQYSESFSQSYWTKSGSSIASNNAISPDGSLNASKLVEGTNNGFHWMYSGVITVTNATIYNLSVFAKKGERNYIRISQKNGIAVIVNLEDKVFDTIGGSVLSSNITELINDWVRIEYSFQTTSTTDEVYIYAADNGDTQYQGDGTSGVYIYGAMLEQGSYPTSYIPTNGESGGVTRSAETATGSGDAATFSGSECSFMFESKALLNNGSDTRISISDGTNNNRIEFSYGSGGNEIFVLVKIGGVNIIYTTNESLSNLSEYKKFAFKLKSGNSAFYINGFEILTSSTTFSNYIMSELKFENSADGFPFYGKAKQLQYYDSALTDSKLEQLTSWTSFTDMAEGQLYSVE